MPVETVMIRVHLYGWSDRTTFTMVVTPHQYKAFELAAMESKLAANKTGYPIMDVEVVK